MPRVKQKTKAEDLMRVRTNQRNSRQRKRDYIAELERRIASYEAEAEAREDELGKENRALRALLHSSGVDPAFLEDYLAENQEDENQPRIDLMENRGSLNLEPHAPETALMELGSFPQTIESVPEFPPQLSTTTPSNIETFSLTVPTLFEPSPEPQPHLLEFPSLSQNIGGISTDLAIQESTPCAIAIQILIDCSKKTINMLELDLRLRKGYRSAVLPLEGCRVDNAVLLAVLAEIVK